MLSRGSGSGRTKNIIASVLITVADTLARPDTGVRSLDRMERAGKPRHRREGQRLNERERTNQWSRWATRDMDLARQGEGAGATEWSLREAVRHRQCEAVDGGRDLARSSQSKDESPRLMERCQNLLS